MAQDTTKQQPETEEEGMRMEALRRLKVRQQYKAHLDRMSLSSTSPSDTPAPLELTLNVNLNTSK